MFNPASARSRFIARSLCLGLLLAAAPLAWAAGTPAGTNISNTASLIYVIGLRPPLSATSNTVTFRVDELIQPILTWQDAASVAVGSPAENDALTFLLTNGGNGQEAFGLSRTNGPTPLPTGNYTPLNGSIGSIYVENGLMPGFQASGPNADPAYVAGSNDPNLAPGAAVLLYVISNTPSVATNTHGEVQLAAASLTPGAAGAPPGTSLPGLGQGGGDAVVGSSRARAQAIGSYLTSGMGLVMSKSILNVLDPQGGSVVMPGAVLTYQILATLSGSGSAINLTISDPLPSNTSYVPGSITVNGIAKTDDADGDNAQFLAAGQTLTVALGTVAAPAAILINFRARIN